MRFLRRGRNLYRDMRASREISTMRLKDDQSVALSLDKADVVVSMTTFPERLSSSEIAIESILRQTEASRAALVVVLAKPQFGSEVPLNLRRFVNRGVTMLFDDGDIRSYKKLLPVLDLELDRVIVTADDDVIYPRSWLRDLLSTHRTNPSAVVGHRGTEIKGGRDDLRPYLEWPAASSDSTRNRVFLTGMGGILYPPGTLSPVVRDRALAMRLCPSADDIWFKAMSLLGGSESVRIQSSREFPTIRGAQKFSLRTRNVAGGGNDIQFRTVMDHFNLWDALN